ncbi:MAG: methyltransferase domain-containing protein [Proteobacteria bacterium]|nr:methyltransferase domain-containing protein [Pseudomonadota bacterium]
MSGPDPVTGHYARGGIAQTLLAAVRAELADGETLGVAHLAPVDEFHIGGIETTRRFVPMLGLQKGMQVLDIGSGIGGTARFISQETGAQVTGIDLTPEFVAAAAVLSAATGSAGRTRFVCAGALDLPFGDAGFDGAVTLHVAMNIADKAALYREAARVLRPGAVLGIYDVLAGPGAGAFVFPVPWAASRETSWLATPETTRSLLDAAGFAIVHEEDRHAPAMASLARMAARSGPQRPGLHLLIGEGYAERMAGLAANLAAHRCAPWEFVCVRR